MKSVSLFKQLMIGFLISIFASISIHSLFLIFSYSDSINLSIAIASIFYIVFTINNSHIKRGRLIAICLLTISILAICLLIASSQIVIATCLLQIFMVRVVYYQSSWLAAAFDAILIVVGFFIASGVLVSTNSWFLGFWCFFFVQSFIIYQSEILLFGKNSSKGMRLNTDQKFWHAKKMADQAIQQISNQT
jgi:hypothetical protein